MSNLITLKTSAVPGKAPLITDLALGEIAVNSYDGIIYLKKMVGAVETIVAFSSIAALITSIDGTDFVLNSGQLSLASQPVVNALNFKVGAPVVTPPSGEFAIFSQMVGGRSRVNILDDVGRQDALQRSLFANNVTMWLPNSGGSLSASIGTTWNARNTGTGTSQTRPVLAATNAVTRMIRNTFNTGTTTIGAAGTASTDAIAYLGNAPNSGGFFFFARFALETYLSTQRFFVGLSSSNVTMQADPTLLNNTVGVGKNVADGTLQFICRNATASTKVDTLLTPNPTQVYDLYMHCAPNSTNVLLTLMDPLNSITPLAQTTLTVNTPAVNQMMYAQAQIQSSTGTTAKQLALSKIYIETDS